MISPGQLRRWRNDIPLLPHERACGGNIFLVVEKQRHDSGAIAVRYLEEGEMFADFASWTEKWSDEVSDGDR